MQSVKVGPRLGGRGARGEGKWRGRNRWAVIRREGRREGEGGVTRVAVKGVALHPEPALWEATPPVLLAVRRSRLELVAAVAPFQPPGRFPVGHEDLKRPREGEEVEEVVSRSLCCTSIERPPSLIITHSQVSAPVLSPHAPWSPPPSPTAVPVLFPSFRHSAWSPYLPTAWSFSSNKTPPSPLVFPAAPTQPPSPVLLPFPVSSSCLSFPSHLRPPVSEQQQFSICLRPSCPSASSGLPALPLLGPACHSARLCVPPFTNTPPRSPWLSPLSSR